MKSRSFVLGALVLALLIAWLPAAPVTAASGPQSMGLAKDHLQVSARADQGGKDLGDIVVSEGDPSDLLGGNGEKPTPIEQSGDASAGYAFVGWMSWLLHVIKALCLPSL
jgi:hypothetical protein